MRKIDSRSGDILYNFIIVAISWYCHFLQIKIPILSQSTINFLNYLDSFVHKSGTYVHATRFTFLLLASTIYSIGCSNKFLFQSDSFSFNSDSNNSFLFETIKNTEKCLVKVRCECFLLKGIEVNAEKCPILSGIALLSHLIHVIKKTLTFIVLEIYIIQHK